MALLPREFSSVPDLAPTPKRHGRTRTRLAWMLTKAVHEHHPGVRLIPDHLWSNRVPHSSGNVCCWGATAPIPGTQGVVVFYSWDTMTECVRNGIVLNLDSDNPHQIQVFAREQPRSDTVGRTT